eukprot:g12331.t1
MPGSASRLPGSASSFAGGHASGSTRRPMFKEPATFLYYDEQGRQVDSGTRLPPGVTSVPAPAGQPPRSQPPLQREQAPQDYTSNQVAGHRSTHADTENLSPRVPEGQLAEDFESEILRFKHDDLVRRLDLLEGVVLKMVHQEETLDQRLREKEGLAMEVEKREGTARDFEVYFRQVVDPWTGKSKYPYRTEIGGGGSGGDLGGGVDQKNMTSRGNEAATEDFIGEMCEDFAKSVMT